MTDERKQQLLQEKLTQARVLLSEVGVLADELYEKVSFFGMAYEPNFGWFTPDGELQSESEWNSSQCVIGSSYAEGYGMSGWNSSGGGPGC